MAYKKVPLEVKVNALREAIELKDIKKIAGKFGISRDTIKNDYNKLVGQIDTIIRDRRAGPKVKTSGTTNLGIVMDENGHIRGVQAIVKKQDINELFKSVLGGKYNPKYFLFVPYSDT